MDRWTKWGEWTCPCVEDEDGNLAYTDEELWGDVNDIMVGGGAS